MVTFEWSWFSFIVGVVSAIMVLFWVVVGIAVKQYRKQAKQTKSFESLVETWSNSNKK